MPTRKTSTKAKPKRRPAKSAVKKNEEALMEFEHFVSQKPSNNKSKSWLALTLVILIVVHVSN